MNGEIVILPGDNETSADGAGDWPGRAAGLTPARGRDPRTDRPGPPQPADRRSHLPRINSVKTYIRTAYRKINVRSRTQAVLWGVDNGCKPDTLRTVDPALLLRRPPSTPRRSATQ